MADTSLKPVKVKFWVMDRLANFMVTTRFEIIDDGELIGYYRIYDDPDTNNIAFYGVKNPADKRGILPPKTYKAQPQTHKLIRYIIQDLEGMGYYIPDAHTKVTDYMLTSKEPFPSNWDVLTV